MDRRGFFGGFVGSVLAFLGLGPKVKADGTGSKLVFYDDAARQERRIGILVPFAVKLHDAYGLEESEDKKAAFVKAAVWNLARTERVLVWKFVNFFGDLGGIMILPTHEMIPIPPMVDCPEGGYRRVPLIFAGEGASSVVAYGNMACFISANQVDCVELDGRSEDKIIEEVREKNEKLHGNADCYLAKPRTSR